MAMFYRRPTGPDFPEVVFQQISNSFLRESHLLQVSAEELRHSYENGLAVVGIGEEGDPIAYTRMIPLLEIPLDHPDQWFEAGSAWTSDTCREKGIGRRALELLLVGRDGWNILATTTNACWVKMAGHLGFGKVLRRDLPPAVWGSSCTCSLKKTGDRRVGNPKCRLAFGEAQYGAVSPCFFLVTRGTADRFKLRIVEE